MRRLLGCGLLSAALSTVVASPAPARADTTCVTITYMTLLDHAAAALSEVPPQPVAALTAITQAVDLVPSADGDLAPVIGELTATPPDVTAGRQRIELLATTLALPAGSACNVNSQDSENVLHQVYSSPVFADLDQNQPPSVFARIGAAINWVLSHLFGLLGSGGSILLGLLVLALIAGFVAYRLRGVVGGRRAPRPEEPATAGNDPDDEWKLALAAAQRGDYREAVRRAFRSALLDMGERRVHVERAWTTREMLASLSMHAELLAAVAPAAAAFDEAWYGNRPVSVADWDIARTRCEAVRLVARRGARVQAQ